MSQDISKMTPTDLYLFRSLLAGQVYNFLRQKTFFQDENQWRTEKYLQWNGKTTTAAANLKYLIRLFYVYDDAVQDQKIFRPNSMIDPLVERLRGQFVRPPALARPRTLWMKSDLYLYRNLCAYQTKQWLGFMDLVRAPEHATLKQTANPLGVLMTNQEVAQALHQQFLVINDRYPTLWNADSDSQLGFPEMFAKNQALISENP